MSNIEQWKPIPGYEGYYEQSTFGRTRSVDRTYINSNGIKKTIKGRILKQFKHTGGYVQVCLYKRMKKEKLLSHRLTASVFLPNPDNLPQVNHKDENKQNNCVWNLEWCTAKYNVNYSDVVANKRMPIEVYKDGELVGIFCSQAEAGRHLELDDKKISLCILGKRKHHKGYSFKKHNPTE